MITFSPGLLGGAAVMLIAASLRFRNRRPAGRLRSSEACDNPAILTLFRAPGDNSVLPERTAAHESAFTP
jgi:hypothetical protein